MRKCAIPESRHDTDTANVVLNGLITGFFYICEYLNVTPSEFFETECSNPEKVNAIIKDLKKLDDKQLDTIASLVKGLIK